MTDEELLRDVDEGRVFEVAQPSATYVMNNRTWKRVTRPVKKFVAAGLVRRRDEGAYKYPPYELTDDGRAALLAAAQAAGVGDD